MALAAIISAEPGQLVALLSDDRAIRHSRADLLAAHLWEAGVRNAAVSVAHWSQGVSAQESIVIHNVLLRLEMGDSVATAVGRWSDVNTERPMSPPPAAFDKAYTQEQVTDLREKMRGIWMLSKIPNWYHTLSPQQQEKAIADAMGFGGVGEPLVFDPIAQLKASTAQAHAALDDTLAYVEQSNQRIAMMALRESVVCKHTMSSLPDVEHSYEIDHNAKTVRISAACLDMALVAAAAEHIEDTHGVTLIADDKSGGVKPSRNTYQCVVQCCGLLFKAEFVRLAQTDAVDTVLQPVFPPRLPGCPI